MEVTKIREGLWRWTAPHPDWTPASDTPTGWGQMVGCVYSEPPLPPAGERPVAGMNRSLVLFDPLAPPEGTPDAERFWRALDLDVARTGLPVAILVGNQYHARSSQAVFDRYRTKPGASIWVHHAAASALPIKPTTTFRPGDPLPGGVVACPVEGLTPGEAVFYLPADRVIVAADALLGSAPGHVRLAPASWAPETEAGQAHYQREFRPSLRRLLDLPIEMLLVSHGAPILEGGRRALEEVLDGTP